MRRRLFFRVTTFTLVLLRPLMVHASPLEPAGINIGGSSFRDGFGRVDPGFVYQQYLQFEHYTSIASANGQNVSRLLGTDINAIVSLNQMIYVSPLHLFGGALGAEVLLPFVDLNATFAPNSPTTLSVNRGVEAGDLTWGAFLQMPPVILDRRPVFDQRFEIAVLSPIGGYNRSDEINPSSGFWSLNPYWAVTIAPSGRSEVSLRLNYLHNFPNSDPAGGMPPFRAGDAVWVNFAASYSILPRVSIGINGYYFRQFQNDIVDGQVSHLSETANFSLGPGLLYQLDEHNMFFVNAYLPVSERNTPRGFHLVFRWVHVF